MDTGQVNGGFMGVFRRVLEKHGPIAAMLVAVSSALYVCVIVPFQDQQTLLTESNKKLLENTILQSEKLNGVYTEMAQIQKRQEGTLREINENLQEHNSIAEDAITMQSKSMERVDALIEKSLECGQKTHTLLQQFTEAVNREHPEQNRKLDELLQYHKEDPGGAE